SCQVRLGQRIGGGSPLIGLYRRQGRDLPFEREGPSDPLLSSAKPAARVEYQVMKIPLPGSLVVQLARLPLLGAGPANLRAREQRADLKRALVGAPTGPGRLERRGLAKLVKQDASGFAVHMEQAVRQGIAHDEMAVLVMHIGEARHPPGDVFVVRDLEV